MNGKTKSFTCRLIFKEPFSFSLKVKHIQTILSVVLHGFDTRSLLEWNKIDEKR